MSNDCALIQQGFLNRMAKILEAKISPVCFHPTTIMCVDDDPKIHEFITPNVINTNATKIFNNAEKALAYINNEYKSDSFLKRCISLTDTEVRGQRVAQLNIENIHKEIYSLQRFKQISVLILDYAMAEMHGIEFAKQLKSKDIKIIMLTGEVDYQIALEAFNEQLIHKFIKKNDANLFQILIGAIEELQKDYFIEHSNPAINILTGNDNPNAEIFFDHHYADLVKATIKQNKIYEYYLIDAYGSYLMLDRRAHPSWLLLRSTQDFDLMLDYALQNKAPETVITALKNREKMLFLGAKENSKLDWDKLLHPVQALDDNKKYFYAYITQADFYYVDQAKIVAFEKFIDVLEV